MSDWQLIETAPKDGTWILLYGSLYVEPHARVGFWSDDGPDWYDSEAAPRSLTDFGWSPTHWMPFLAPLEAL